MKTNILILSLAIAGLFLVALVDLMFTAYFNGQTALGVVITIIILSVLATLYFIIKH